MNGRRFTAGQMKNIPDDHNDFFPGQKEEQRRVFTVSEINRQIKELMEAGFPEVWVEGEVSGVTRISTGTVFFNLKDGSGLLKCVIFPLTARGLKFELKDGDKLICRGGISVYERDGRYQLYVRGLEPKGLGSLQLALEQLKKKLEKEGLFAPSHKRAIPYLPARIGIVTSAGGAALKDILKVIDVRFRGVHLVINPAKVQGEGAAEEIACAIKELNVYNASADKRERIEVLIVGRGGGSIEDLWAFNEEPVARAIYASDIPVVSAVGHERDWTIADLVADLRAPTPSAAAEMVIPEKADLRQKLSLLTADVEAGLSDFTLSLREELDALAHRMGMSIAHCLEINSGRLESAGKKLQLLNPAAMLKQFCQRVADFSGRSGRALEHLLQIKKAALRSAAANLYGLSPLNVLARGYSITFASGGGVLRSVKAVSAGETIKVKLYDGEIAGRVTEVREDGGIKI